MIYVVRHGQTDWNLEGKYQGHQDIDINQQGVKQALEVKMLLKDVDIDIAYSSPLIRAVNTAKIIYDGSITLDDRLIERGNGDLEGRLKKDCHGLIDFSDPNDTRYGVEPLEHFRERINSFFEEILKKHKHKNILVVTHGGVTIYAKCFFDGEPTDGNYNSLIIQNCNILSFPN